MYIVLTLQNSQNPAQTKETRAVIRLRGFSLSGASSGIRTPKVFIKPAEINGISGVVSIFVSIFEKIGHFVFGFQAVQTGKVRINFAHRSGI